MNTSGTSSGIRLILRNSSGVLLTTGTVAVGTDVTRSVSVTPIACTLGETLRLHFSNVGGTTRPYQNAVTGTVSQDSSSTYASPETTFVADSTPGTLRQFQMWATGTLPSQTITTVNAGAGITPGTSSTAVLSGFTDTPNAATFGAKAATSVSYSAPNLSFVSPDYVDGQTYPDLVGSHNFIVTSTGSQTATLSVPLNLKTGWSQVALASAVTGDDTYFSEVLDTDGVSIADGTRITWPTTAGFAFLADGGIESDIERTVNAWVRDVVSGIMYEYNVTVDEFGNVVSATRSLKRSLKSSLKRPLKSLA